MNKDDKQILVIKSDILFKEGRWQGLKTENLDYYIDLIKKDGEFKRRGDMEIDPSFKQLISYILFKYKDKYFLYRYLKEHHEKRLMQDYIIGIGGHVDFEDAKEGEDVLIRCRDREWDEEVDYRDELLQKKLVGILNDDSRPVETVHLALVYLFEGSTPNISIKEKDQMIGEFYGPEELADKAGNTGGWAPIIYNEYIKLIK